MSEWMAMTTLLEAHRVGLLKMAALEQAGRDFYVGQHTTALPVLLDSLHFFDGELQQHFCHEEQALFPVLARYVGYSGPIGAMLGEHESIWRNVDELTAVVEAAERSLSDDTIGREIERLAKHVAFLLRGHIGREDSMLFPLAERTLDERAKQQVVDSMNQLDHMRQ